jgi:hypothetical protein
MIQFAISPPSLFLMPSDLDGAAPPPRTPNFFLRHVDGEVFGGNDRLEIFAFKVNWGNPAASTFTQVATLNTAAFDSQLCAGGLMATCVPQPGTSQRLETLTVWPMWRLQYRNFGTHETLMTNHTVDADGRDLAGIRWYELRRAGAGAWTIFQQGTHAPDGVHRWMGSIAMDGEGNTALGYSVSSERVFPGIRYAFRTPADAPGALPQERILVTGGGSQTHSSSRWGNYSTMDVDPEDRCTFWYTTEYYDATSLAGWETRISAFSLSPCGEAPPPDGNGRPQPMKYAAKLICGLQRDGKDMRLARGFYATTINVHNPNRQPVTFRKRLALTFPPEEQRPGKVIPIAKDKLGPDQALKVDCLDIRHRVFPNGFPTPYIEGYVVLDSTDVLNVTGVYTTAGLDRKGRLSQHSSIDVELIPGRASGSSPVNGGRCPDLVADIGRPSVSCSGGAGSCVTSVELKIANTGSADAGPFDVRVLLDPSLSVVVTRSVPELETGDARILNVITPPGGNCFDPDCTIRVTVDSADAVSECNEHNNTSEETTLG